MSGQQSTKLKAIHFVNNKCSTRNSTNKGFLDKDVTQKLERLRGVTKIIHIEQARYFTKVTDLSAIIN